MSEIDIKSIVKEIDVLGRVCPYPLMMVKKGAESLKPGDVMKVLCDSEPSVEREIPTLCQKKGLIMESARLEDKGYWELFIMKPKC